MRHSKEVAPFTRYFYQVKSGEVVAGQDGPGPAGGGAFSCTYSDFVKNEGNASNVISFIQTEFGDSHYQKVLDFVKSKLD